MREKVVEVNLPILEHQWDESRHHDLLQGKDNRDFHVYKEFHICKWETGMDIILEQIL